MTCPHCQSETPEEPNFCQSCRHAVRDLRGIKLGKGTYRSHRLEKFWETGDPRVFSKLGDPDYDPRIAE